MKRDQISKELDEYSKEYENLQNEIDKCEDCTDRACHKHKQMIRDIEIEYRDKGDKIK